MIAFLTLVLVLPGLIATGTYLIITGLQLGMVRKGLYLSGMAMLVAGIGLAVISSGRAETANFAMMLANARVLGVGASHLLILAGIVTLVRSLSSHKLSNEEFYSPY